MTWVVITIFAALMQTIRTASQKNLKEELSTTAITWVRFSFGIPFAILYFVVLSYFITDKPSLNNFFLLNCFIASIAQIIGTFLLISLFSHKNFAVGTTYTKTETMQTAILGVVFFGEYLSLLGILSIMIGIVGIFMISTIEEQVNLKFMLKSILKKYAIMGILSGSFFSLAGLFIKNAITSLESNNIIINASFTLLVIKIIQTFILGLYIYAKEKEQFKKIKQNYKPSLLIGLSSVLGSIGWFTAFSMVNVAYVKVVGQIELIFSLFTSYKIFREKLQIIELCGISLVIASMILLILH